MSEVYKAIEAPTIEQKIRAKKMLLTVGLFSIVMMFAAFISAYVVMRYASPYWVNISIPGEFWISTMIIVASSFCIHFAKKMLANGKRQLSIILTTLTMVLGILFCLQQYQGFLKLSALGMPFTVNAIEHINAEYGQDYYITTGEGVQLIYLNGNYFLPGDTEPITNEVKGYENTAASYFNFIVAFHAAHVFLGILVLVITVILFFTNYVNQNNSLLLSQAGRYWHFVDLLWVFLLLFLYLIH